MMQWLNTSFSLRPNPLKGWLRLKQAGQVSVSLSHGAIVENANVKLMVLDSDERKAKRAKTALDSEILALLAGISEDEISPEMQAMIDGHKADNALESEEIEGQIKAKVQYQIETHGFVDPYTVWDVLRPTVERAHNRRQDVRIPNRMTKVIMLQILDILPNADYKALINAYAKRKDGDCASRNASKSDRFAAKWALATVNGSFEGQTADDIEKARKARLEVNKEAKKRANFEKGLAPGWRTNCLGDRRGQNERGE